jgi:glycogen debranching enzyme
MTLVIRTSDGFIEYSRESPNGLVQQGWKDSGDSVFYEDGNLAEPPVRLGFLASNCRCSGQLHRCGKAKSAIPGD